MKSPQINRTRRNRPIHWHRRSGIAAALFILLLAATGLLLNHTSELGLDKKPLRSEWLLNWYGVEHTAHPRHFSAGEAIISQMGEQLFINGKGLWQTPKPIIGAAANDLYITLAFADELALFTFEGKLLERITDLPEGITRISAIGSSAAGNIAVRSDDAIAIADSEMIEWRTDSGNPVHDWSHPLKEPPPHEVMIRATYQPNDLNYERLLLDLHSGRLFGPWGPYVMDGTALAMLILAITGLRRSLRGNKSRSDS